MANPIFPFPWFSRPALIWRSRHIAAVLTRHGLDWLLFHLESEIFRRRLVERGVSPSQLKQARELRLALEELGPTFIKLGQALSTRPDLLPKAFIEELDRLQDEVPPAPFEDIEKVIEVELGQAVEDVFVEFDRQPIASASIGQVYSARLKTGEDVVIKVRRPGVEKTIEEDLEIMMDMAVWATNHSNLGRMYDLVSLLEEFSFRLRNELDYQLEGHNADIIRLQFDGDPCVYIPQVYWDLTTSRVITLERVYGVKITDIAGIEQAGIDRGLVAENSGRFTLRQLFEFGFFHADPHPGNFYVQPDGTLAVMDFGMVGRFSPAMKNTLMRIVLSISRNDIDGLVDVLLDAGITSSRIQRSVFSQELSRMIESYAEGSYQYMTTSQMLEQMMGIAFRHSLQLPSEMTMLGRLITINEGISLMLNPEFRMLDFATPYVKRFWREQRSPENLFPRLGQTALEGLELTLELPRQTARLLKQLERGQIEFRINYESLSGLVHKMQLMTNRLALAMLLSAVIIALGLVTVIYHPTTWQVIGEVVFGLAFISSLVFGIWLIFSIWRSGR